MGEIVLDLYILQYISNKTWTTGRSGDNVVQMKTREENWTFQINKI